ncbi:MAG: GIY-YIG nuclease family protein [Pseudomonadota bacterium]
MPRYRSLDEIFDEPDEFGLLDIKERNRGAAATPDARSSEIVLQVNAFYESNGRIPDDNSLDLEEMKLGTIWRSIRTSPTAAMMEVDRNRLLGHGHPVAPNPRIVDPDTHSLTEPDWRDEVGEEDIPASLDDILGDEDLDVHDAVLNIRNVTPALQRQLPDHRADMFPCPVFEHFEDGFTEMQSKLESGDRKVLPVQDNVEITVHEGDYFIHRGLLVYVAEKTELSRRSGKPDHRLRIVFSNGMENDPLASSFRKALAADKTARIVERAGFGRLDPEWDQDSMAVTGTVYVARSLSSDPEIAEISRILHKVGVTSQDVRRRIADAKNDPTFLLAPVEIVATYELRNLERMKVEHLLHRFFDNARPQGLVITDRFGKPVHPREWFYVLPEHVSQAVQLIRERRLHEFRFDPQSQSIVQIRSKP